MGAKVGKAPDKLSKKSSQKFAVGFMSCSNVISVSARKHSRFRLEMLTQGLV